MCSASSLLATRFMDTMKNQILADWYRKLADLRNAERGIVNGDDRHAMQLRIIALADRIRRVEQLEVA